ncbi:HlyD family efflux transporter periplasmic adaptor subunit [Kerstersia similis]|uniref:HlyD family efflux transporter periplasmic adaptor subunit n=1 Tax=Kerstersia similis TaxID=206505 RepID=UPI0039F1147C
MNLPQSRQPAAGQGAVVPRGQPGRTASAGNGLAALHDELAQREMPLRRARRLVQALVLILLLFLVWAWWFEVDEVSSGSGRVVPISREQVVQSLEGGIVTELLVAEGDIVEKGQVLARLDPTQSASNVEESAARYRAALASAARLQAEVSGAGEIRFPPELNDWQTLRNAETRLFRSRREGLRQSVNGLKRSLELVNRELGITSRLVEEGAASNVELIRLQRQRAELQLKLDEAESSYMVQAREELARANAEVEALSSVVKGRSDVLERLTHRSPVRGVVKDVEVTTIGGVVPPNGRLMEIVPLGEQLLVEARIAPRDIAFIHPGQAAMVKITAYDYAIYGGLPGKVVTISPDTIRDEVKPDVFYYRVFILTDSDALVNKAGTQFPIVPGMIASVDIRTGSKSILDYLIKPLNRAREALRER